MISIDDFKSGQKIYNGKTPFFISSKILLKRILKLLGIFAEANTTNEFELLKPTLIAVRGHYSQRKISNYSLEEIIRELKNRESSQEKNLFLHSNTALHYRLGGDRVTDMMQNYHKNVSIGYYKQALTLIEFNPDEYNILVFSDRMDQCKQLLKELDYPFYFIQNENNVLDFTMMSLCDINIVSNSTFSWWAAYMNQHDHKKIIVTESEWFGPGYKHFNLTNTFPTSWIRL